MFNIILFSLTDSYMLFSCIDTSFSFK